MPTATAHAPRVEIHRLGGDPRAGVLGSPVGAGGKALILNASYEPLSVVSGRRALVLVLSGKADMLEAGAACVHSEHLTVAVPSVVRLRTYVRVPYRRMASLTRRGVFIRDDHTCQYCGRQAENVDHVHPRSRGGAHEWENVVAACQRCNSRKGDRTPSEANMPLRRRPFAPKATFWLIVAVGRLRQEWAPYIGDALAPAS